MAPATQMTPVTAFRLEVATDPAPNAPERFRCLVQVFFANGQNGFLNVETPQEFMAIAAMLQVPGQLFFQAGTGQDRNVLIKQG